MNFKNMYKENLKCEKCDEEEEETQEHVLLCSGWTEERGTLDTYRVEEQAEFFARVLKKKMMQDDCLRGSLCGDLPGTLVGDSPPVLYVELLEGTWNR